jgi:hypothetical protein
MPARWARQPTEYSFPILLVPMGYRLAPHRCGSDALCAPVSVGPPRRRPFVYLGRASPAVTRADLLEHLGTVPRYRLEFRVPNVKAGLYKLVIYSSAPGAREGSLITEPVLRRWLLRVRAPDRVAAAHSGGPDVARWVSGTAVGVILLAAGLVYWRRPAARRSVRARSTTR